MKILFFLLFSFASLLACKSDDDNNTEEDNTTTSAGTANITLSAGGEQYKINGPCGWAVAAGKKYIGANDETNNLKTFSTFFNIAELPSQTTTYTLVKAPAWNQTDTDPTHIWMNIAEIRNGNSLFEYTSDNSSGTLKLVVDGKKVSVDLTGIVLKPNPGGNPIFTNLNVGAFSNPGTLSGTLTFYRD